MKVIVNGKEYCFEYDSMDCDQVLKAVGIKKDGLIAELDGKVYTVTQFSDVVLKDGSKLELIRIMGGG